MSANPTPARADPLAALDDLSDFRPTSTPKPKPAPELVREVSEAAGFPSRAPVPKPKAVTAPPSPVLRPQRRHRTGRNVQVNIKVTAATAERLNRVSDAQGWVFGETLEHALDALEASLKEKASQ